MHFLKPNVQRLVYVRDQPLDQSGYLYLTGSNFRFKFSVFFMVLWMALGDFKLSSPGSCGGKPHDMICTEKSVTGEETEDCVIGADVATTGCEKYYALLLFCIACVYIFSIIYDSQRKSDLLDEHTKY